VAGGAVDGGRLRDELAVVDQDGPDVDEDEQRDVGDLLQREEEGEHVVGDGLREAVERVEGVRGERRRHDPLVVRLVQGLVDGRVVQAAVDQVDEEVGEEEEERELQDVVPEPRPVGGRVVELGVAAALGDEADGGQQGHQGHGAVGLDHLELDLVLEELGVREGVVVEDEVVGGRGDDEVEEDAEEPGGVS